MKLKPCPFCKASDFQFVAVPVIVFHPPPRSDRTRRTDHALSCVPCGALGPPANDREMAAYLWNRRTK